ncbi:hypothetical protein [Xenorhabdus entomophaga]|uniref:hypothetical protein n=1 Tax=Xenorhabdus entomophaga TaxID=3136257 RepID=UPI0030F3D15A
MSSNHYTQTPNFVSASSGNVDPRTRLFGFNHSLTTLVGNSGMGPSLDLTLSYSPTTSDNSWGLGIGVMFTMTWYDKNSHTLYLSSGETFKIEESSDGSTPYFNIKQSKIQTVKAEKYDSDSNIWYRIIDRDSNITDLYEVGGNFYRPKNLWSPLGHQLHLTWSDDGGNPYLSEVTDDSGTELFSAAYSDNNGAPAMTLFPSTTEEQTFSLFTSNNYLTGMKNAALPENSWQFEYCDAGIANPVSYYHAHRFDQGSDL